MIDTIIIRDIRGQADALQMLVAKHASELHVMGTLLYNTAGVKQIELLEPTLVIMDLNVPSQDNFALFDELQYRNFFLVYHTGYVGDGRKIACCGIDYLLKPLDNQEFVSLLNSVTQRLPFRQWSPAVRPPRNEHNAYVKLQQQGLTSYSDKCEELTALP